MNSIRRRLNVFFVVVITLLLGISGAYSYWRTQAELAEDLTQTGKSLRSRLETSLPSPLWNFDDYQLDRILDSEMISPKIQQIVIENNGRMVAGRVSSGIGRVERLTKQPSRYGDEIEFDVFYQDNPQRSIGKVLVRLSSAPMEQQLQKQVISKVAEIVILDIILVLALSRSLTLLLVRPLKQLHDMLQRAADQTDAGISDAALRLPASQFIEFSDVTSGYNRIARRLLDDLRKRKETEDAMREAKESAEKALQQLKETQNSLVQAEKMASLGGLVAGIAHEINTPVGVILTSASVLSEDSRSFQKNIESGTIKKSDLLRYTETAVQSSALIQTNAERAAALIQSFKRVAVDQTSEARRAYDLKEYIEEVILSLRPTLRHSALTVDVDCPEDIKIDGYPGALSQIITNMVTNTIAHAFDPGQQGTLCIEAEQDEGVVRMVFSDDGKGIQASHIGRIFDPFFTTRRGAGGSGLGLNIVYNLVTQTLGGTISVSSAPGSGTRFSIIFPSVAPEPVKQPAPSDD
ncbi:His Kinase A (phospho-acceptor) domain-containing protein [Formivibrio citricus]|uniref:histidine kinase n=1 Tax=Formivibrio citricus TaxID=83765 RepID=A0A1I4V7B3_9NEIS|nr:HAMP domain-containing sensor histidine kinase [Formivibrio citricus]SFM97064.1 His Kinase A (phospho-acceptor) domain-containing protein [Formivibrio citricus]